MGKAWDGKGETLWTWVCGMFLSPSHSKTRRNQHGNITSASTCPAPSIRSPPPPPPPPALSFISPSPTSRQGARPGDTQEHRARSSGHIDSVQGSTRVPADAKHEQSPGSLVGPLGFPPTPLHPPGPSQHAHKSLPPPPPPPSR